MTPKELKKEFIRRYIDGTEFGWDAGAERCVYRTLEGQNCAIGLVLEELHLEDDHPIWLTSLRPAVELGHAVRVLGEETAKAVVTSFEQAAGLCGLTLGELNQLQILHDGLADAYNFFGPIGHQQTRARLRLDELIPDEDAE